MEAKYSKAKKSAGILLYRLKNNSIEFFLVHPGGPFWKNKDSGAWSIPKGEIENESPLEAALREFEEETGINLAGLKTIMLSPVQQKSGKIIHAWAIEKNVDCAPIKSNMVEVELKGGKKIKFPEVDKAGWFDTATAKQKINPAQFNLIEQLLEYSEQ